MSQQQSNTVAKVNVKDLESKIKIDDFKQLVPKGTPDVTSYIFGVARQLITSLNDKGYYDLPEGQFEQDMLYCMTKCYKLGLDPLLKDIYFRYQATNTGTKDHPRYVKKIVDIVSIDAFRKIAQRAGGFRGYDFKFGYDAKGEINACYGYCKRKMSDGAVIAFKSYVTMQDFYDANSIGWKKPINQLQVVAEKHAYRKAFPEALAKSYGEEEFNEQPVRVEAEVKDADPQFAEVKDIDYNDLPEQEVSEDARET